MKIMADFALFLLTFRLQSPENVNISVIKPLDFRKLSFPPLSYLASGEIVSRSRLCVNILEVEPGFGTEPEPWVENRPKPEPLFYESNRARTMSFFTPNL